MYLSILLHIYQPSTQFPGITKEIIDSSYRLILKILKKTKGKVTLNIPASLTEQLAGLGGEDVIRGITELTQKGQIELTASAAYHPLLSRLPKELIKRQILLNTLINQKYFGKIYCPNGFFPPEMAYSSLVGEVLEEMNFDWVILDEHGFPGGLKRMKHDVIYIKKPQTVIARSETTKQSFLPNKKIATAAFGDLAMTSRKPLKFFFRDEKLSIGIAFSQIKTLSEFKNLLLSVIPSEVEGVGMIKKDSYFILALDGETFGHHQPGQEKLLSDILSYNKIKIVTISELKKYFPKELTIRPLTSCWGVSTSDMRKKIYWPRWSYPDNPIHKLQWQLTKLVIKNVKPQTKEPTLFSKKKMSKASLFDKSLQSDQYWWASHKPYWYPEMFRRVAKMQVRVLQENPNVSEQVKKEAESICNDIVETAHKMYGEQIIAT